MKINWKEVEKDLKEQNKLLKKWMTRNYGKRCKSYVKTCIVCEVWQLYDGLVMKEKEG